MAKKPAVKLPASPVAKSPNQADLLWECHHHALALCLGGWHLGYLLVNRPNPDWKLVTEAMAPIEKAMEWLATEWPSRWESLALFDGLRPDAVFPGKCNEWPVEKRTIGYRSWHAAMVEMLVFGGNCFKLPVWLGSMGPADECGWMIAPLIDWNPPDPDPKRRAELWLQIRSMALRQVGQPPDSPHWSIAHDRAEADPAGEGYDVGGWLNVTQLDPYSQMPNLAAEYAYAVRNLDRPVPKNPWSPYLMVNQWCVVLGMESRNTASDWLERWESQGKAEKAPTARNEGQTRGWRVLLSELSDLQQAEAQKLERECIVRAMKKATKSKNTT